MAFFAAIQISELLPRNKVSKQGILLQDVQVLDKAVQLLIRKCKTDQMGAGNVGKSYLPSKLAIYFLIHEDGSSLFQISSVLKKCLVVFGQGLKITSQSFTIGAATEAAWGCFSDATIKHIGMWSSKSFKIYVRPHLSF